MLWFIIGLFTGSILGVLVMAIFAASRMDSNEDNIYQSKIKEQK